MVKLWDWDEKDQPFDNYLTNCIEFNDSQMISTLWINLLKIHIFLFLLPSRIYFNSHSNIYTTNLLN